MVVFVDLDDDPEPPERGLYSTQRPIHWSQAGSKHEQNNSNAAQPLQISANAVIKRSNPNRNALTEALGCYPIISEIAASIDLNTLDNLSRTCRQIHENLLQFRKQLIAKTLRCCNKDVIPNRDHTLRYRARAADWYFVEEGGTNITGKVGSCARDMVSECRRCNRIVCRNCTIKPPAPILLRHRHRRLCPTCIRVPLPTLVPSVLSASSSSTSSIAKSVIKRSICTCPTEGVWLCQPCGRGLRSADTTYESIWRWRARYGPTLGGLGTGFGEGNRSFECGRASECLAARLVEEEIDCDAMDARDSDANKENDASKAAVLGLGNAGAVGEGLAIPGTGSRPSSVELGIEFSTSTPPAHMGPGYARHEIEGIGGIVKKKLVRMVSVGACVTEWEDEKEHGRYLIREMEGKTRSWCGWCWRVIPGATDKDYVE